MRRRTLPWHRNCRPPPALGAGDHAPSPPPDARPRPVRRPGRRPRDGGGASRAVRDLRGAARARLRAREARGGLLDARVARGPRAARRPVLEDRRTVAREPGAPGLRCDRPRRLPLGRLRRRDRRRPRARLGRPADALRPGPALGHPGRARHAHAPAPREFRAFVTAAARRYAGRVRTWSIWNEPNQPQFLKPQFDRRHRPVSPGSTGACSPRPSTASTTPASAGRASSWGRRRPRGRRASSPR